MSFTEQGHGYGLVQYDMIEEFVLQLYAEMAHDCTRGSWTCFESRGIPNWTPAGGYTTPSQSIVPLHVKWMLAWEDPSDYADVTLLKAIPRSWLSAGEAIKVRNVPLTTGSYSFNITSKLVNPTPTISCQIAYKPSTVHKLNLKAGGITLRLRAPEEWKIAGVTINGKVWSKYSRESEQISVPLTSEDSVSTVEVRYSK